MDTPSSRRSFLATLAGAGASAILAGCSTASHTLSPGPDLNVRPALDLVILNGLVIDGTGAPERRLDVGIRNGSIVTLGDLSRATSVRTIDARGLKVVPGFIDIHSHTDLDLFKDPYAPSKVRQGVTTEVTGQDGESAAPLGASDMAETLRSFREAYGFDCPYRTMDEFFTLLSSRGTAQNIISFVGLGTLRAVHVGFDNRPATGDELAAMKKAAMAAIAQGCFGASTGLEYTPGSYASQDELAAVMSAIPQKYRLYATHMRNEDNRVLDALAEAIAIARASGARLQVSHLKAQNKGNWPKQEVALRMLDDALASGLNVHADRYPYIAFNTGLTNLFPLWSRDGGTDRFLERLKDRVAGDTSARRCATQSRRPGVVGFRPHLEREEGREQNVPGQDDPADRNGEPGRSVRVRCPLQLQENAGVGMVGFGMDEAGTEMVLAWKNAMVASDAGPHSPGDGSWPHPRSYGTFPRAIAHYQRERKITTLPDMIRKMTSLPAEVLGLSDRGILARGKGSGYRSLRL